MEINLSLMNNYDKILRYENNSTSVIEKILNPGELIFIAN